MAQLNREGNTFSVEKSIDRQLPYYYQDKDGNKYPIYVSSKGKLYVKKVSKKSGKEYKYYLPEDDQAQIKKAIGMN
jgi:hypothetical protein